MKELQELLKDIEKLRDRLYHLINVKNADLQDTEIISASHELNTAINRYNDILSRKTKG